VWISTQKTWRGRVRYVGRGLGVQELITVGSTVKTHGGSAGKGETGLREMLSAARRMKTQRCVRLLGVRAPNRKNPIGIVVVKCTSGLSAFDFGRLKLASSGDH
jgi:hypothetical protein